MLVGTVNEAGVLAERMRDDLVWKTANLVMPVGFGVASFLAIEGLTSPGMSVAMVDLLGRICDAVNLLAANPDHPLDDAVYHWYCDRFAVRNAPKRPVSGDDEAAAIRVLLALWPYDRPFAAMCANQMLVHARIGLFGVYPRQVADLNTAIDDGTGMEYVREHGIQLAPQGLTRDRMGQ